MNQIIVSGHSYGGATSIAMAIKDKRIKACLAMDPWALPLYDHPNLYNLCVPTQVLLSEGYQ